MIVPGTVGVDNVLAVELGSGCFFVVYLCVFCVILYSTNVCLCFKECLLNKYVINKCVFNKYVLNKCTLNKCVFNKYVLNKCVCVFNKSARVCSTSARPT